MSLAQLAICEFIKDHYRYTAIFFILFNRKSFARNFHIWFTWSCSLIHVSTQAVFLLLWSMFITLYEHITNSHINSFWRLFIHGCCCIIHVWRICWILWLYIQLILRTNLTKFGKPLGLITLFLRSPIMIDDLETKGGLIFGIAYSTVIVAENGLLALRLKETVSILRLEFHNIWHHWRVLLKLVHSQPQVWKHDRRGQFELWKSVHAPEYLVLNEVAVILGKSDSSWTVFEVSLYSFSVVQVGIVVVDLTIQWIPPP